MSKFGSSKFRNYGLRLVGGSFGAGKTKNVFQDAFLWKKENPDGVLIANVPYDFIDIYFSSKSDLNTILSYLKTYIEETNIVDYFKSAYKVPIRLIIDEGHIYYFSRDFQKLDKEILLILTQCRKRSIAIDIITQEVRQIDTFMRNLSPYVYRYKNILLGFRRQSIFYFQSSDVTSITDEKCEEIESERLFPDWIQKLFNPSLKNFFSQKYLTYHIIGLQSLFDLSYEAFYSFLKKKDVAVGSQEEVLPLADEDQEKLRNENISGELREKIDKVNQIELTREQDINGFVSHKIKNS